MPKKSTSKKVNLDFAFFSQLLSFYQQNRGRIRTYYRNLTKHFLNFNDPSNSNAFLRQPQFEALEIYVFLKEYLDNKKIHLLFQEWSENKGKFQGRTIQDKQGQTQLDLFKEESKKDYEAVFKAMRSNSRDYPNYIFALTMGVGKTILMATCIFYEFLLANKFPNDEKYCHNALVFAPDKTVLQSLKEIQTFDLSKVVPPEYVNFLQSNLKIHFLEDSGATLSVIDQSRFNIIISNTQKIILKRKNKEETAFEKFFKSSIKQTYEKDSVYEEMADLLADDEPEDDKELTTNQRFEKLKRVTQLGIYIDEAHHAFGNKLAADMGTKKTKTSLRTTVDELAANLKRAGTQVVACYNYTGTPYVGNQVLPEVVYAFSLQDAINKAYLKKVRINAYANTRNDEFVKAVIDSFLRQTQNQRHEGMLPKIAFFAATIDELQKELKPAVEKALTEQGISTNRILVNVGNDKLTSNDDIREFNRLDSIESDKQFILLVNKGREGWNCRSLFGVALYRKPKSKIFVLQATMRCLRSIGEGQQTGYVYLSEDNQQILEDELQQNFRVSISDMQSAGQTGEKIKVKVLKEKKIKLVRVRRQFTLKEKQITTGINLELDTATTPQNLAKYQLLRTEQEGLTTKEAVRGKKTVEDITYIRDKREFSLLTLVFEISRYLNKSPLFIENILSTTVDGVAQILEAVNQFNELLYDWIIPRLFKELYDLDEYEKREEYEVELIKLSKDGYYNVTANPDKTVSSNDPMVQGKTDPNGTSYLDKSFHLDTYCFDSQPEQRFFWDLLREKRVKEIYFTGMLTHKQSEFYIQYIDPDSLTLRSYYPDFLIQKDDNTYIIVEVKGDNMIDDPIVQAKKEFTEQMAIASGMTYRIIKGSDASGGKYQSVIQ
ncbi:MAG: TnsA endonuclease N-terminal domain-containing protein [Microcystaceae cyanobacterium]